MIPIQRALVTGGCGFIGSHVVDRLVQRGASVIVLDNLMTGFERHIEAAQRAGDVRFCRGDILDDDALSRAAAGVDAVFHFAAHADVRGGLALPRYQLDQNIIGTARVLEAARQAGARLFVFASSAAVYGEPSQFPTDEDCPRTQTSLYGATKLAGEALTEAYAQYVQMRVISFRFVSWVGERYSHGVVFDFVNKLNTAPDHLRILGDGQQKKSYLHIDDGVDGIFRSIDHGDDNQHVFNVGHDYTVDVNAIARLVIAEMGLAGVRLSYGGGSRGWVGDSPLVHLDTSRLKALGWRPCISVEDGIRRTARYLLANPWLMEGRIRVRKQSLGLPPQPI